MSPPSVSSAPSAATRAASERGDAPAGPPLRDHPAAIPAAVLVLVGLLLLPILHAPFRGDDLPAAEVNGYLRLTGDGLLVHMAENTWDVISSHGRPSLLSALPGLPVMSLLGDHPALYHLYLIAFTLLDGALLYVLLRRLRLTPALAGLALMLGGAFIQFRLYHDPLQSYFGLVQAMFATAVGSLILMLDHLRTGRRRSLVWSALLYLACVLLYEAAYPLVGLHVALAFGEVRGRAALRACAPFVGVTLMMLAATAALRAVVPLVDQGYSPGGGLWVAARTYLIQLTAPLPMANIVFDPTHGGGATTAELVASLWRAVAVAAAVAALCVAVLRRPQGTSARLGTAAAIGLALWLLPPVLLSISPKYQTELAPGRGYIPVLMQGFGVALLIALGIAWLLGAAQRRSRLAVLVAVAGVVAMAGLTTGVTAFNNVRVVAVQQPALESRDLAEKAAERGVLASMPERSSLLFTDRDVGWSIQRYLDTPYLMMMLADKTGRTYDARLQAALEPEPALGCARSRGLVAPDCASLGRPAAWVRVRIGVGEGAVVVAPFSPRGPSGYRSAPAERLSVYTEGEAGPPGLVGTTADGRPWTSEGVEWRIDRRGDGWMLASAGLAPRDRPVAATLDDPRARVDFAALPPAPQAVRIFGTKRLLP